jgi:hypothetical protein
LARQLSAPLTNPETIRRLAMIRHLVAQRRAISARLLQAVAALRHRNLEGSVHLAQQAAAGSGLLVGHFAKLS